MSENRKIDKFCVLPWIHLDVWNNGDTKACCLVETKFKHDDGNMIKSANLTNSTLKESINSDYYKEIRKKILKNEFHDMCKMYCMDEEKKFNTSKRIRELKRWKDKLDYDKLAEETREDGSIDPNIKYIELRLGTKCQLSCVMCSPRKSTGWIQNGKEIRSKTQNSEILIGIDDIPGNTYNWHKRNPKFWDDFYDNMRNMEILTFAGGEPFVIDEHYEILEYAVKKGYAKNMLLIYNSNCVEWRDNLFSLWENFKHVNLRMSVDDIKERNEYIRYPSKWSNTVNSMKILDSETTNNVKFNIACCISALNVHYIPDFFEWKLNNDFKKLNMFPSAGGGIATHLVYGPIYLNPKVLPYEYKIKIREKYERFYKWWGKNWQKGIKLDQRDTVTFDKWKNSEGGIDILEGTLNFMEDEDLSHMLPTLKEYLRLIDSTRKTNYREVFPDLAQYID